MASVELGALIHQSFSDTIGMLFQPFDLRKWIRWIFIALLAGAFTGGNNLNLPDNGGRKSGKEPAAYSEAGAERNNRAGKYSSVINDVRKKALSHRESLAIIGVSAAIFVFLIVIFFIWLNARFQFVWLNAVANDVADVGAPFGAYRAQGNSLFRFYIVMAALFLTLLGIAVFWGYGVLKASGLLDGSSAWAWTPFLSLIPPFIGIVLVALAMAVVTSVVDNFAVPVMAAGGLTFLPAVRQVWDLIKSRFTDFLLFYLVWIVLHVVAFVMALILTLAAVVVVLLAGALIFGLGYLLFVSVLHANTLALTAAVVAGIPFLIAAFVAIYGAQLPLAVFFRRFSLGFLSSVAPEDSSLPHKPPLV